MPLYDYACPCGVRVEVLVPSWSTPAPPCPACGSATTRRPPAPALRRDVAAPTPMSAAPTSWESAGHADRETVTRWRRELDRRQEFEARYPEHAEVRQAVAAHEGVFERRPLTYQELAARAADTSDAGAALADAGWDRLARTET